MSLTPNKRKLIKVFNTIDFQQEFNSILVLVSEICEIPFVFASFIDVTGQTIKAKIGLDFIPIPPNILEWSEAVIQQNKIKIVSEIKKDIFNPSENSNEVAFFAGFPISTNENIVLGTLCIMDAKPKELSSLQLKYLDQAVLQMESLLQLHNQKKELQNRIKEKETQFQLFIDNSKEIFYELDLEGTFTFVSKNLFTFLGREADEIIGENIALIIHPDDLQMCFNHLNTVAQRGRSEKEVIYRVLHKDGHYVWHSSNLNFSANEGQPIFIVNSRDINAHIEAQQKLMLQKDFYEKILDRLPTDVAVFDSNHRYIYLNPAAIQNGELRKFIIGKNDFEYAKHTGRADTFAKNTRAARFMQALESREIVEWEESIQRPDGEITDHTRKFAPVFLENGSLEMMVGFGLDITESKKIQEEILKSRQLTRNIINNLAVGILIFGTQNEIIDNNAAACEMLGLTRNELLGKTPFDPYWKAIHLDGSAFLPEDFPITQALKQLKPVSEVVIGVYRPIFNDYLWILADAIPVFGDSNELLYVIYSFTDISSRITAEDALRISNERFYYSSKATSDALWDWDMSTDKIFVGDSYTVLFGHQLQNNIISGQECGNFIHQEDKAAYYESMDKYIKSDVHKWSAEYRYLKLDGTYAFVKEKAIVIRNQEGEAIRMIGAMQDITAEKKLSDELLQSEEQFKSVFKNSAVGMALVTIEGGYIDVNDRLCEMLGYSIPEMKCIKFQQITHHEDLSLDLDYKEKLDSGEITGFSSEKRFLHKNKCIVWVHMFVSASKNNKNEIKHYIAQIIDITKRKKIEEENKVLIEENNRNKTLQLDEAKNMYRLLADNTIDLVCLHNIDTSFQYVSPSIEKLLGYTPEDLIGKFPEALVHPEDRGIFQMSIADFTTGKKDVSLRMRVRNVEGNYIWFESNANWVIENNVPVSFHSSSRDITERKEAEEIIKINLQQERKLNELRTNLVSTISHEFRTPMSTIRTSAELIALYLQDQNLKNSNLLERRVTIITEEIDRIVELMNAVLTISKEDSGNTNFNPVSFDLKDFCLEIIDKNYLNNVNLPLVTTNFKGTFFSVKADKNLLEYALMNILNNALKYSGKFATVVLTLSSTPYFLILEIIDTGIGIPEQDQLKLFNPFFRASNTDGIQGNGLGLHIAKTFVEKNSGTIELASELGKGTTVTMRFSLLK